MGHLFTLNSTEKTGKNKKKSIKSTTAQSVIAFAVILIITLGTLIGVQHWVSRVEIYTNSAYSYSKSAANILDGDTVKRYIETHEQDEYYRAVQQLLTTTIAQTDLKYYYVFVPRDNCMEYVWDGDSGDGKPFMLGYEEKYMNDEDKAAIMDAYDGTSKDKLSIQKDDEYGLIGSAYTPILDSNGQPVAIVAADLPMADLLNSIWHYIVLVLLSVSLLTIIAIYLYYRNIDKNVIEPIKKLEKSAGMIVGNIKREEDLNIDIHTGDELEDLAHSIMKMDGDLKTYIKELSEFTAEKERMGAELNVAKRIQSGALPSKFPPFPEKKEFDLYATMTPAKEVGGDFYDFFMVDDDHIALVMADVSSKGIPAALFMMESKILIKSAVQSGLSPSAALRKANEQLLENDDTDFFVTVWLAVIDINTGKGLAANAGHEHPSLKRKGGVFEMIKYKHSLAVATIEGIPFKEHGFQLEAGDELFVYTDGVTEATNTDNELFGEERLLTSLNGNKAAGPEELLPQIKADIDEFVGDAPQFDDITMLAFRYNGR